ncbi:hypothetical protein [Melittangium boletus]|uniref:hypothetical protein n=1 Tax=Melittangium boletus TaxID=83453 RepID=UPI00147322A3|nr:hypothetical protein [Melittangium boletus]
MRAILEHLGLPTESAHLAPARGPPQRRRRERAPVARDKSGAGVRGAREPGMHVGDAGLAGTRVEAEWSRLLPPRVAL